VGDSAGNTDQGNNAVAVGRRAQLTGGGDQAVAIGINAGYTGQGESAVAIGADAGQTNQAANSIVINATGVETNNTQASSLVIKPVRDAVGTTAVMYDAASGEVTHTASPAFDLTGNLTGNVTGNVTGDVTGDVTGNVTGNVTGDVSSNYVNTQILKLLTLTNSEIDALTPEEGMLVYNETFRKIQIYSPGSLNISNTPVDNFTDSDDTMRQNFVNQYQGDIESISVYGKVTDLGASAIIISFEGYDITLNSNYWDSQVVNLPQWHTFTFTTPIPVNTDQTYEFMLWGPGTCNGDIVFAKNNSFSGGSVVSSGSCGGTPLGFANGEDLVFIINYVNTGSLSWNNLN
jgi:hypothetical protein